MFESKNFRIIYDQVEISEINILKDFKKKLTTFLKKFEEW